jgi:hypothetical protein
LEHILRRHSVTVAFAFAVAVAVAVAVTAISSTIVAARALEDTAFIATWSRRPPPYHSSFFLPNRRATSATMGATANNATTLTFRHPDLSSSRCPPMIYSVNLGFHQLRY